MTVRLNCPHCGKKIKAPAGHAGKRALCPRCREEIFVPALEPAGVPAPAGAPGHERAGAEHGGAGEGGGGGGGLIPASPHPEEEDLIDMTAMVDIVFFLLIFFMVTSMHAMQASISVPPAEQKQKGSGPSTTQSSDDTVTVRIEADSTVLVNDEDALSRQDVIAKLREAESAHMTVRAHGECKHGTVVMVLDAGTDAGIEDVRLITEDDSES
ncbi:MAG TPA: biopolymer transporter ExbD [Pirellulales bacterium]|nr:biopolymer transporter ExbD [Pirellulales bacterium]